jgi:fucose 4-O-acetylase-like acetyltransferase
LNFAKRLDCGAFTAAFVQSVAAVIIISRLSESDPACCCNFLFSFARFWFSMAVQIKPQKYEDLYQINRAGGALTGIGRLRLER